MTQFPLGPSGLAPGPLIPPWIKGELTILEPKDQEFPFHPQTTVLLAHRTHVLTGPSTLSARAVVPLTRTVSLGPTHTLILHALICILSWTPNRSCQAPVCKSDGILRLGWMWTLGGGGHTNHCSRDMSAEHFTTSEENVSRLNVTVISVHVWKSPPVLVFGPGILFKERFLVTGLTSSRHITEFKYPISCWVFFKIHPFQLTIEIY